MDLSQKEIGQFAREQVEITSKLERHRSQRSGWRKVLKHPVQVLLEKPLNILILTLPLAVLLFLIGTAFAIRDYGMSVLFTTTLIDDIVIISILVAIVPVAIMDFRESRRMKNLEEALPNFFRDLAGMNDSGMTLPNAIHLVAQGEYSTLTPFIRRLDNEMSWNTTFIEAIQRFRTRLGTPLSDRSIDLIAKASKAGGDVSEVLRAAARDTYEVLALRSERKNNMLIYVIIVLISFMVFVFVILILVSTFLSTMATAGSAASAAGAGAASFIGNVDLFFYTRLFSHAAMIQGIFSGLVAGQMGEARVVAGLKYSAIMLVIAWLVFRFMV
ncbi:MAG TPA: type II secretion system F family protein [Methanolinea sp.]|nr:type II secretion system F family protein [Methanolinea sp.]